MDRSLEARAWRRSVAAGVAALFLSVGGHVTFSPSGESGPCPFARANVGRALDRMDAAAVSPPSFAHRVARAALRLFADTESR